MGTVDTVALSAIPSTFIQKEMDFVRESNGDGGSSLQSWYGAPQHEDMEGPEWEAAYYGGSSGRDDWRPVGFVPGIEYRVEAAGEELATAGRAIRSPSASD